MANSNVALGERSLERLKEISKSLEGMKGNVDRLIAKMEESVKAAKSLDAEINEAFELMSKAATMFGQARRETEKAHGNKGSKRRIQFKGKWSTYLNLSDEQASCIRRFPIYELVVPKKVLKILQDHDFTEVGDLLDMEAADMRLINYFGPVCLDEVERAVIAEVMKSTRAPQLAGVGEGSG